MSTVDKRLGSQLTFDVEKEKDIIDCIDKLSQSHKLGNFIAHLLRLAFESPEEFGNGREVLNLINKMENYNISPPRYSFFSQVAKETEAMKKKIDSIYELAYKTYILAQAGKMLGLESKADNSLRAAFVLERQITDMCLSLGINNFNHSFISNKIEDTHERADKALEFIIESYDSIFNELKQSLQVTAATEQQKPAIVEKQIDTRVVDETIKTITNTDKGTETDDDEIIDLTEKPQMDNTKQKKQDEAMYIPIPDAKTVKIMDTLFG